jgi:hypothetical protein
LSIIINQIVTFFKLGTLSNNSKTWGGGSGIRPQLNDMQPERAKGSLFLVVVEVFLVKVKASLKKVQHSRRKVTRDREIILFLMEKKNLDDFLLNFIIMKSGWVARDTHTKYNKN